MQTGIEIKNEEDYKKFKNFDSYCTEKMMLVNDVIFKSVPWDKKEPDPISDIKKMRESEVLGMK